MGSNPPGDTIGLEDLNDVELDKEIAMRAGYARSIQGAHWDAICEKMVRQIKRLYPNAAYLGLAADSDASGDFYSLVEVVDAKGQMLGNDDSDEKFYQVNDSFAAEYSGDYEEWFTVDDRTFFDLKQRKPIDAAEFDRRVGLMVTAEVAR